MKVIDHSRCGLIFDRGSAKISYEYNVLRNFDAVIPRIGASITAQGALVINLFEMKNVFSTTRSEALLLSRNKLRSLQKLAQCGVDIPKTAFPVNGQDLDMLVKALGGFPVVVKLLESTHGIGVMLIENKNSLEAILETVNSLSGQVIIQEFIREANGADIRAIVVAGEIVAVMERQARDGEFRSNLHRGASAKVAQLNEDEIKLIKSSVRIMGLDVAGVDILRSERGPLVMEVNASPGLEGIETVTGIDVAGIIIDFIERRVRELKNYRSNLKRLQI